RGALIETGGEAFLPAALVGSDKLAFLAGKDRKITIAALSDGRVINRLEESPGALEGLAASPDGNIIYFIRDKFLWTIPANDGTPQKLQPADGVAVDPAGHFLTTQRTAPAGVRLFRLPLGAGKIEEIVVKGDTRIAPLALAGNALDRDGKLVVTVAPPDSWFWAPGVLDLKTR